MPYKDRERQLAYMRGYSRWLGSQQERHFVGCDTEGMGEGRDHRLWLVRVGENLLHRERPLHSLEILDFLSAQAVGTSGAINVAYGMGYDVAMILKDLPQDRYAALLDRRGRERVNDVGRTWYLPVLWKDYEIDAMGKVEFRVRRHGTRPWFIVSDVIGFFQSSFVRALEKWEIGTPAERAVVLEGKLRRAELTMGPDDIAYNALECRLLEKLMTEFAKACEDSGLRPRRWQGAGQLAAAMFAKHGVTKTRELAQTGKIWQLSDRAYYGARFERSIYGNITGPVYEYDINSAYPFGYRLLPCLKHGRWCSTGGGDRLRLSRVRWGVAPDGERPLYGPFPIRTKQGALVFPLHGEGLYWSPEVDAAREVGWWKIEELQSWWYHTNCDCKPFSWVPETYDDRVKLGKATRGYPLKLGLNSCYGKTAQRTPVAGPYTNYIYAGIITAATRAMLLNAMCREHGGQCILGFATDSITSSHSLPLALSDTSLGAWSQTRYLGQFVVQSGVALKFVPSDGWPLWEIRSRGYRESLMHDALLQMRDRLLSHPGHVPEPMQIQDRIFYGPRLALAQGHWEDRAMWRQWPKELRFDWQLKRQAAFRWMADGTSFMTFPLERVERRDVLWSVSDLPPRDSVEGVLSGVRDPDESGEHLMVDEIQIAGV